MQDWSKSPAQDSISPKVPITHALPLGRWWIIMHYYVLLCQLTLAVWLSGFRIWSFRSRNMVSNETSVIVPWIEDNLFSWINNGHTAPHKTGWWYTYPSEKYEFVSWDYYSQHMESHNPAMFQTTNHKIWGEVDTEILMWHQKKSWWLCHRCSTWTNRLSILEGLKATHIATDSIPKGPD